MNLSRRNFLQLLGLTATGLTLEACGAGLFSQREEEKIHQNKTYPQTTSRGKAVIINGDESEFRHLENVIRAEQFLLGIGYGSNDIEVLSAPYEGFTYQNTQDLQRAAENGGFKLPHILGPATLRNVEFTLEKLVDKIAPEQELFVYITGHGGVDEKTKASFAQLNAPFAKYNHDQLSDIRLKELLRQGNKGYKGIVVFDGCNGEGFAEVVGGDNITAITKSKKGQSDPCVYFANEFFYSPFSRHLKREHERALTLRDAVEYTKKVLDEGGAEAQIVMKGSYNPLLRETIDPQFMLFSVFLPNSPVQSYHTPAKNILENEGILTIVKNEQLYQRALAEHKALLYIQADGCQSCEVATSFLAERLGEKEKKLPVYLFANDFNDEHKVQFNDFTTRLGKELGIQVSNVPLLLRYEQGKIVSAYDGVPVDVFGYGNLPDRYIWIPSRMKMDNLLRI